MPQDNEKFEVVDLHIQLMHSDPPISRTVRVPTKIGLHHLHDIIQCVFQWTESHLHAFYIAGLEYQNPEQIYDDDYEPRPKNEKLIKLKSLIEKDIGQFSYTYDFGDNWQHSIKITKIYTLNKPKEVLKLLSGEYAAPPEDVGGISGFEYLKEVLADPTHEDYEHLIEWCGSDEFDPKFFDEKEVALRLENLRILHSRYFNRV